MIASEIFMRCTSDLQLAESQTTSLQRRRQRKAKGVCVLTACEVASEWDGEDCRTERRVRIANFSCPGCKAATTKSKRQIDSKLSCSMAQSLAHMWVIKSEVMYVANCWPAAVGNLFGSVL